MSEILDPKNDIVFKALMTGPGTEPILISMISAVIQPPHHSRQGVKSGDSERAYYG